NERSAQVPPELADYFRKADAHEARLRAPIDYCDRLVAFLDVLGWRELVRMSVGDAELRSKLAFATYALVFGSHDFQAHIDESGVPFVGFAQFSDSIILSANVGSAGAYFVLGQISSLQRVALGFGLPIRGAITIGPMYHVEQTAFGPALTQAYLLEQNAA